MRVIFLFVAVLTLFTPGDLLGHEAVKHLDPELLSGWRTWLHLTVQWGHLTAFALWVGLTAGTSLLKMELRLDVLLYSSWILFLVILGTGIYNMEWSAGIPETPSLLLLPVLKKIPYALPYTLILGMKVGLYVLAILLTLVITIRHVRHQGDEARLRRLFLLSGSHVGILIALLTAVVLFYHEVADLWPTAFHSSGGVLGPEGPGGQTPVNPGLPPQDFGLLASRGAWIDIGLRWVHLVGFGLWVGGHAVVLLFGGGEPGRFLVYSWSALTIQILSGIASMGRWTPFYLAPYVGNLTPLFFLRFGRTYTLFMALKHALVIGVLILMVVATVHYRKARREMGTDRFNLRPFAVLNLLLGLAIGYIMMVILLLHEGVDHAL